MINKYLINKEIVTCYFNKHMLDQNALEHLFNKHLWIMMIKKVAHDFNLTFLSYLTFLSLK